MFNKDGFKTKNVIFTLLVVFVIWFICQIKEIALLFFGSYVLACSLSPIVDKLSSKMPRALAATVVLSGILIGIVLFFIPIFTISYNEILVLIKNLPSMFDKSVEYLSHAKIMGQAVIDLINFESILSNTTQITSDIVNKSINITFAIFEAIAVFISVGMIVFYLIYEKNAIKHSTLRVFPPKTREKAIEIMEAIEEKVGGYVIAQALSMATVAVLSAVGLSLLKIQYAMLLGLVAGILDIIPIFGPTIALLLGVMAALSKGWIWVFPTIAVFLVSQWVSNNFVRPLVFGKFLDLHPLWIVFSFLIAAKFLGVWGVILAPAIAALIATLFDEFYIKVMNRNKDENIV